MDPQSMDMEKILGGSALGATVALLHHLIAGLIIAPVMWGSIFYYEGPGMIGFVISDTIVMVIIGGVMGAIGAFVALTMEADNSE